jgi:outer membrane protein
LTRNKLRSTFDLTFANVNLSQAQLLQLDAQNNADTAMAALDEVLGLDHPARYALVDNTNNSPPPLSDEQTGEPPTVPNAMIVGNFSSRWARLNFS